MSEFTKGPWVAKVQTDKRHKVVSVMTADGEALIGTAYSGHVGWPAAEANAALIADAPALLLLLEQIITALPTNRDWLNPDTEYIARKIIKRHGGGAL
jgi:hypothetical protein